MVVSQSFPNCSNPRSPRRATAIRSLHRAVGLNECSNPRSPRRATAIRNLIRWQKTKSSNPRSPRRATAISAIYFVQFFKRVPILDRPEERPQSWVALGSDSWIFCSNPRSPRRATAMIDLIGSKDFSETVPILDRPEERPQFYA